MKMHIFKSVTAVIRDEAQRRERRLANQHPDAAYDQWLFVDAPFLNEFCLMLLVTLRHQIERELVMLAARKADDKKQTISVAQYRENVQQELKLLEGDKKTGWKNLYTKLGVRSSDGSKDSVAYLEVLRHLANSYKHDPFGEPCVCLLELLNLPRRRGSPRHQAPTSRNRDAGVNYAPLPESKLLREGLAVFVGLGKNPDYCDIAEKFVDIASEFLQDLQRRTKLLPFEQGLVSLNPEDFEH